MVCKCMATLQVDGKGNEDATWLLINRFASAHVPCGYMSPVVEDKPEKTKRFNIPTLPDQEA